MKYIFITLITLFSLFISAESLYAVNLWTVNGWQNVDNLRIWASDGAESDNASENTKLNNFDDDSFIWVSSWGERWLFNTLIRFARDIKNIFFVLATIYFLIICLKLIFSSNTEEELGNFKKWIIWITIGLIVMQIAFVFTQILFDQWVSASLGATLIQNLVLPFVELIQTLASIFFIAVAIFAFYRLVTANGNEEAVKSWKITILYALIGFLVVQIAQTIVEAFYGRINCASSGTIWWGTQCLNVSDVSQWVEIIIRIINFLNSFVAIVVLIMIIYAGAQILLSGGDEEKIKKWKQAIIYIAIGLFLLVINFLLITFFLRPDGVL